MMSNFSNVFHHVAEIARQAAQIKIMRKFEKQAMAQAAKEARKQQGKQLSTPTLCLTLLHNVVFRSNLIVIPAIMAAEERRKKREQMKILKQQVRIFLHVHYFIYFNCLQLFCLHSNFVCSKVKRF